MHPPCSVTWEIPDVLVVTKWQITDRICKTRSRSYWLFVVVVFLFCCNNCSLSYYRPACWSCTPPCPCPRARTGWCPLHTSCCAASLQVCKKSNKRLSPNNGDLNTRTDGVKLHLLSLPDVVNRDAVVVAAGYRALAVLAEVQTADWLRVGINSGDPETPQQPIGQFHGCTASKTSVAFRMYSSSTWSALERRTTNTTRHSHHSSVLTADEPNRDVFHPFSRPDSPVWWCSGVTCTPRVYARRDVLEWKTIAPFSFAQEMTTFQHRKYFFHLANKYASKLLNVKFILPRLNLYIFF